MRPFAYLAIALGVIGPLTASDAAAITTVLTNGTGPGSARITVDEYGRVLYGDALFHAVGVPNPTYTITRSDVLFGYGGERQHLYEDWSRTGRPFTNPGRDAAFIRTTDRSATSTFALPDLDIVLEQSISDSLRGTNRVGSALNQTYRFTNTGKTTTEFDLVRVMRAALEYRWRPQVASGRLVDPNTGTEVLFSTELIPASFPDVTIGVTALGGTLPERGRYEVNAAGGVDYRGGLNPRDVVIFDFDGDGVSSPQPDEALLTMRNLFTLDPGETGTYFTQTLFGQTNPAEIGTVEALPALPDAMTVDGGFVFLLEDLRPGVTVFFDPEIAIGYTYEVTGAAFDSVTAPTFGAVADPDGYTLSFTLNGAVFTVALAAGETIRFGDVAGPGFDLDLLTMFTITGIDPDLGLDPENPTAFVTGAAFRAIEGPVTLTQTAISSGTAAVPLPAPLLLLGSSLLALGIAVGWRRSK